MDETACSISKQLASADIEERIAAVRSLAELKGSAMEQLRVCLADEDWRVRKAAVETFARLPHPENYASEVIELLHHQDNAGLRNAAIEILVGLGPLVVAELQREIKCPDVEVRKFVIDILGEIGDPRCSDDLVSAMNDQDINVRYAAVETLGKLRVRDAVEPMLELMKDPDPGLKFTLLQALAQIGGKLPIDKLFDYLEDRLLRKTLFDCFGKVGDHRVVPPLIDGLNDPMRNVREAALKALYALLPREAAAMQDALADADRQQIAAFLDELLTTESFELKQAALALYGQVGQGRDLLPLLECVADERLRSVTLDVFRALGEGAYAELIANLDTPDSVQNLYLTYVGGELGYEQGLPLAMEAAHSADPQLRYAAARALGELGAAQQVEPLLALLDDPVADIQDMAAAGLGALGGRHCSAVMRGVSGLLADPDQDKRMRVLRVLSLLDGDGIEEMLLRAFKDAASSVRCEAIRALRGHDSDQVVSGLTLALTDESPEVRRLAVSALGQCPQQKVLPALKLAAGDADLWVRAAVMRAMESFSGAEVLELLLLGAADSVGLVVIAALETLARLFPGEAPELLEKALLHADVEVVKSAMTQLGRLHGPDWLSPCAYGLLNHSHWDVRIHAAKAIAHSDLEGRTALLEERLLVEGEGLVRQTLEAALKHLRQPVNKNEH